MKWSKNWGLPKHRKKNEFIGHAIFISYDSFQYQRPCDALLVVVFARTVHKVGPPGIRSNGVTAEGGNIVGAASSISLTSPTVFRGGRLVNSTQGAERAPSDATTVVASLVAVDSDKLLQLDEVFLAFMCIQRFYSSLVVSWEVTRNNTTYASIYDI
jgi:hypothetical protein